MYIGVYQNRSALQLDVIMTVMQVCGNHVPGSWSGFAITFGGGRFVSDRAKNRSETVSDLAQTRSETRAGDNL